MNFFQSRVTKEEAWEQIQSGFDIHVCENIIKHFHNGGGVQHGIYGNLVDFAQQVETMWNPDRGENSVLLLLKQKLKHVLPQQQHLNEFKFY